MRVVNIFSRLLRLIRLNVYLSVSRIATINQANTEMINHNCLFRLLVFPLLNFQDPFLAVCCYLLLQLFVVCHGDVQ